MQRPRSATAISGGRSTSFQFDEAFYGTLRQTAAIIAIAAMWLFSKQLTEYSVTAILFWLAVAGAVLSLPNIGLFYGLHHWTEATFGSAPAPSPWSMPRHLPRLPRSA